KRDMVALINHPHFFGHVSDDLSRAELTDLTCDLGIDDRGWDGAHFTERFLAPMERLRRVLKADDNRLGHIDRLESFLKTVSSFLDLLADRDSLSGHLKRLCLMLESAMVIEPSVELLKKALATLSKSAALDVDDKSEISLSDFVTVLKSYLHSITI